MSGHRAISLGEVGLYDTVYHSRTLFLWVTENDRPDVQIGLVSTVSRFDLADVSGFLERNHRSGSLSRDFAVSSVLR